MTNTATTTYLEQLVANAEGVNAAVAALCQLGATEHDENAHIPDVLATLTDAHSRLWSQVHRLDNERRKS